MAYITAGSLFIGDKIEHLGVEATVVALTDVFITNDVECIVIVARPAEWSYVLTWKVKANRAIRLVR